MSQSFNKPASAALLRTASLSAHLTSRHVQALRGMELLLQPVLGHDGRRAAIVAGPTFVANLRSDPGQGRKPIDKKFLYRMLNNRAYIDQAVHKGESYPGEHVAIID